MIKIFLITILIIGFGCGDLNITKNDNSNEENNNDKNNIIQSETLNHVKGQIYYSLETIKNKNINYEISKFNIHLIGEKYANKKNTSINGKFTFKNVPLGEYTIYTKYKTRKGYWIYENTININHKCVKNLGIIYPTFHNKNNNSNKSLETNQVNKDIVVNISTTINNIKKEQNNQNNRNAR